MPFISGLLYVIGILALCALIYTWYKLVWFAVKMTALSSTLKKLQKKGMQIIWHKKLSKAVLGKRGEPTFDVVTPEQTYRISLLSFISTHGRWNIEKTREHYYAEARHFNKWFYKVHKHSGTAETEFDARRELVIQRAKLELPPRDDGVKQILLIWPTPKALTYSHARCEHLVTGSKLEHFEIMHAEDFLASLDTD